MTKLSEKGTVTPATSDKLALIDTSNSDAVRLASISSVLDLASTDQTQTAETTVVEVNLDGITDNSATIQTAFDGMKESDIAVGRLIITGSGGGAARIASTIDLDGGVAEINQDQAQKSSTVEGRRFILDCRVPLKPDAAIEHAITAHGFLFPGLHVRFAGGGQSSDYGLTVYDCAGADVWVYGDDFAGTVLNLGNVSDVAANLKRTIVSTVHVVRAYHCGAAVEMANGQGFGNFGTIWDDRSAAPSQFGVNGTTGDVTIQHYENYAPSGLAAGVVFENIDSLHIGKLLLGDSATYQATFTDCNMVTIDDVYLIGNKSGANTWAEASKGIKVESTTRFNIQTLKAKLLNTVLEINGSDVSVAQAEIADNSRPVLVTGSTQSNVYITGNFYRSQTSDIVIEETVPSGTLTLSGRSREANQASSAVNVVDCLASGFDVYANDFIITGANAATTGGIAHVSVGRLRLNNTLELGKESIGGQVLTSTFRKSDGTLGAFNTTDTFQQDTDMVLYVPVTFNPTAGAAATAQFRMGASSSNLNIGFPTESAPANSEQGHVRVLMFFVPAWWYYKITVSNCTLGTAFGWVR